METDETGAIIGVRFSPASPARTARLVSLLLLVRHGFDVGRYVSLERIVEESRDGYDAALERSSTGRHDDAHDARPWLDDVLGVLTAAYRELEERVDAVRRGSGGTKTEMVRTAVARRVPPFRISDIERELPSVGRALIRNVLKDVRGEGVPVLRGRGRGARYEPVAR